MSVRVYKWTHASDASPNLRPTQLRFSPLQTNLNQNRPTSVDEDLWLDCERASEHINELVVAIVVSARTDLCVRARAKWKLAAHLFNVIAATSHVN